MRSPVVIVGAGLAGASVAHHLGRNGVRATVVEQGRQPGAEASAQNAGMLRRLAHDPVERVLAVRSADYVRNHPTAFRKTGAVLALADDPTAYDDAVADLMAADVDVRDVTADPASIAPALRGASVRRAWFLPDEGLVDAHSLVCTWLRDVDVRLQVEAELVVRGGRVIGVRTAEGLVESEAVVLATAAWSVHQLRRLGLDRELVPLARHLLQSEPHALASHDHPWTWLDDVGLYVRPEAGGWLCSPCDEQVWEPQPGPDSRGPVDPWFRAVAHDKLSRLLPAVADLTFRGGWVGLRTFARDRRPFLGPDPAIAGLWWCTGLGGFGVTCSHAAGEYVANGLLGALPDWFDPRLVAPDRTPTVDLLPAPELADPTKATL